MSDTPDSILMAVPLESPWLIPHKALILCVVGENNIVDVLSGEKPPRGPSRVPLKRRGEAIDETFYGQRKRPNLNK